MILSLLSSRNSGTKWNKNDAVKRKNLIDFNSISCINFFKFHALAVPHLSAACCWAEMHWTFDEILVRFFSAAFVFVNDLNPLNKFISVELWAFIFYLCFKLVKTTETCLFYSLPPSLSISHSTTQWVCFIDADMVGNAAFHEKVHYFRFGMHVCV